MIRTRLPGEKPPVRVLMVSERFAPVVGGLERQALALARALIVRGAHVEVLTRRRPGLPRRERIDGVLVHRVWAFTGFGSSRLLYVIGQLHFCLAAAAAVLRRSRRFDIMHVHGLSPAAAALMIVARANGWRTVAKIATARVGEAGLRGRRFAALRQRLMRGCHAYVAISREIADALVDDGIDPTRVVRLPNFVDLDRFRPASQPERRRLRQDLWFGWPDDAVVVLAMSRMEPRKGIATLLEAIAKLDRRLTYRLAVAGEGPEQRRLEAQVDDLGLGDRVRFLGTVSAPELHFRAADMFVLPSMFEGMPNSLLEALASGLPAVVTEIPGVTDVVEADDVCFVSPGDADALAHAVGALIRSSETRQDLTRRARHVAETRFALGPIVDQYCDLYDRLLAG
jgi:glycosyltransferase involved in cell wall biosynthesis